MEKKKEIKKESIKLDSNVKNDIMLTSKVNDNKTIEVVNDNKPIESYYNVIIRKDGGILMTKLKESNTILIAIDGETNDLQRRSLKNILSHYVSIGYVLK